MLTGRHVREAAERIAGQVVRTPAAPSHTLSQITGAIVTVKFENLQFTASYKERGALNRLLQLPSGTERVVAASAGNFAQGVAHHAGRLGIPAVIVMPHGTPLMKASRTALLGAEVVMHGADFDEASAHAASLAGQPGTELLSPFDDDEVIVGQGTVGAELMDDVPDLDVVLVPTGGGGLLAGMALALREARPGIEIVGVQSERYPAVANAVDGGTRPIGGATIAEGIAVRRPGITTMAIIRDLVDRVQVVPEREIEHAVALYLEIEKTVAEGAGAAPLAALLAEPDRYRGKRVGLVLSGGNIDLRQLAMVTLRGLAATGRLTTFWVRLPDRPGALGQLTTLLGATGANIVEVRHQRMDSAVHPRDSEVEITIETADGGHLRGVLDHLVEHGFDVRTSEDVLVSWGR
jgi:threonine dehydratase